MRVNVNMPQLGESVAEGTIVKWLKKVGDPVQRDEDILEISTDKVDSEIPSPATGILVEILAQEGETIGIGKAIAVIETDVSQAKAVQPGAPKKEAGAAPAPVPPAKEEEQVAYAVDAGEVKVVHVPHEEGRAEEKAKQRFYSPLVKKIAQEERISAEELDAIEGSGAGGRVTKEDVMNYLARRKEGAVPLQPTKPAAPAVEQAPPPAAKPAPAMIPGRGEEIIPMDIMRRRIAEHMVKSKFTAPHVFSVAEVDMTRVVQFRERVKQSFEEREGFKFTITPIVIEASVKALKEFPLVNSSVDGENIILKHYINIGIAVALENGLIVPVIKGADGMNLLALARAANDLSVRARNKRLSPDDVTGSTFSLTNFGVFGNIFGAPIINQPNVAILGIGAIKKRPVVIEGDAIAVRSMLYLSISYDHRIVDGALGDQFLQRIRYYLENFDPNTTL
jgi:2-oxoglutarate dehydrogenase E2 component (dihydrolipoamide succinyltransferase)